MFRVTLVYSRFININNFMLFKLNVIIIESDCVGFFSIIF